MNRKKTLKTLLAYVPADRAFADRLRKVLSEREDIELVAREVREDKRWQAKVTEELRGCDLFVAVLSPGSITSDWLGHELGFAFATCRAVVAVKTRPDLDLPVKLHGLFWLGKEDALKLSEWEAILPKFGGQFFRFISRDPYESPVGA
jgi:hypothetical protein